MSNNNNNLFGNVGALLIANSIILLKLMSQQRMTVRIKVVKKTGSSDSFYLATSHLNHLTYFTRDFFSERPEKVRRSRSFKIYILLLHT